MAEVDAEASGLRGTFAVALLCCPGVNVADIEGFLGGGSVRGFGMLKRDEVMSSEDDAEAAARKAKLEAEEEPLTRDVFARLLRGVLNRAAVEPPSLPEGNDSVSKLLKVPRGPRQYLFSLDMPSSIEEVESLVDGGGFDAVVLITSREGAAVPSPEPPGEDGEPAPPKIDPRELFDFMERFALLQTHSDHNPTSDTAFLGVVDTGSAQDTLSELAAGLLPMVEHRVEYADWLKGVDVIKTAPMPPADMRHYEALLADVPNASTSVPLVLHALCEQVALSAADPDGVSQETRAVWRDNRQVMGCVDSFMSRLAVASDWADETQQYHDGEGQTFGYGDARGYRCGQPSLDERAKELIREVEQRMGTRVKIVGRMPAVSRDSASRDLALFDAMPDLDPGEARRGLLLCEFEEMLGCTSVADGSILPHPGWEEAMPLDVHAFSFVEELEECVMQQSLSDALLGNPEVVVRPYDREDALLIALCNLVPKSRVSKSEWRSEVACHLGFWQWIQRRLSQYRKTLLSNTFDLKEQAHPEKFLESSMNDGGVDESTIDEGDEEATEAKAAEGDEASGVPIAPPKATIPLPPKPTRLYDLDAELAPFDKRVTVYPAASPPVFSGRNNSGRYVQCTVGGHALSVKEGEFGRTAVSIVYADGAVVSVARCREDERSLQLGLSTSDGFNLTLRGGDMPAWMGTPVGRGRGDAAMDWFAWCEQMTKGAQEGVYSACVLQGGAIVVRKRDGTADCLLPDGCWGQLTPTGWEWTNTEGKRQGDDPRFPGEPQHRDAVRVCPVADGLKGAIVSSREDGVSVYYSGNGVTLAQHADGSRIATFAREGCAVSAPHGFAEVKTGPEDGQVAVTLSDGTVASIKGHGQEVKVMRPDGSAMLCRGNSLEEEMEFVAEQPGAGVGLGEAGGESEQGTKTCVSMMDGSVEIVDCHQTRYIVGQFVQVVQPRSASSNTPSPAGRRSSSEHASPNLWQQQRLGSTEETIAENENGEDELSAGVVPRLEPFRLMVLRRDGTGYEMLHKSVARASLRAASAAGAVITQTTLRGGGMRFSVSSKDVRGCRVASVTESVTPRSMLTRSVVPSMEHGNGAMTVRELDFYPPVPVGDQKEIRKAMEKVRVLFDAAAARDEEMPVANRDPKLVAFLDEVSKNCARARQGAEVRGCEAREEEARMREGIYAPLEPPRPMVERPPARIKPSAYRGVVRPDDPKNLRCGYFEENGIGAAFLATLPGNQKSENCTKARVRAPPPTQEDQDYEKGYDEEDPYRGSYDYERVQTGTDVDWQVQPQQSDSVLRASHSQPMPLPGGMRPPHFAGRPMPTTSYHVRNLRAAHYDVLNKQRKVPIPNTGRHDATGTPNEHYEIIENPVRRHTHTSSVLQRSQIMETKRLEESVDHDETAGSRMFRLRPRHATFGSICVGGVFRHKMVITNVGIEKGRYRIKAPKSGIISVVYTPGGVAAGMSVVIEIEIYTDEPVEIDEELLIETESEIFVIPITASVLDLEEFAKWESVGGQFPKHVKKLQSAPKRANKSKQSKLATLVGLKDITHDASLVVDLQDEVKEPVAPTVSNDWIVDTTKTLNEIKDMSDEDRLVLIRKADRIRTGKTLREDEIMPARTSSALSAKNNNWSLQRKADTSGIEADSLLMERHMQDMQK